MDQTSAAPPRLGHPSPLIGVVHLLPLPGSPAPAPWPDILARAVADARGWRAHGADAILVENFGDAPFFPEHVPPVTVAALARVLATLRQECPGPCGVNVLRNDAAAALALASTFALEFLRVNVHAGAAVTDQGLLQGQAHRTLRDRARLPGDPWILADLRVKHARPLAPRPLAEEAADLWRRAGADGLLLTGAATGAPPDLEEAREVRQALPGARLLLASGTDPDVIRRSRDLVDGWIVGTWAKQGGRTDQPPDPDRVRQLKEARDRN